MTDPGTDRAQGWYGDPWSRWPERYFDGGWPTPRVRSGAVEGHDPIPGHTLEAGGVISTVPATPATGYWAPTRGYGDSAGYGGAGGYAGGSGTGQTGYGYGPPGGSAPSGYGYGRPGGSAPSGYGYGPPGPAAGTPKTGPLPLHPMNLSEIVDGAFRLFRANFRTIFVIVAVISGPLQLTSALISRSVFGGHSIITAIRNAQNGVQTQTTSANQQLATLIISLVTLFLVPYAAGAISRVVSSSYLGESMPPGPALKAALRRAPALFVAWFLIHILEVLGTVALILPGLIVMALSVCTAPAIVMEQLGPMRGIRRSWQLNRRRKWGIMGTALLSGLMVSILSSIIGTPLIIVAYIVGLRWGWILLFLGGMLSSLVNLSLTAIVATLIYFDGRIRTEGFDLQILARSMER